uniref:C2 domain-containing protein n=1 Tax=Noctiluca scintillans TaxID=2966 RepID=A0A7S1AMM3_NOCSC|mmetsp:Transcript_52627/g.140266  ORF Transcript_52627/g.140266 Transcript_52627/m.140266 type:complete len:616 (+) Transcript_52627:55-1902(+)|eukprot:CAMPEP_0194523934 /NCGR_PEP_ID=MMETSP0253-20130528/58945_1 /TAXON_ID=2966 /ORGANISM="Noctiluca scintillans" /LENGTH=615 /DNA_ID=CAMNT_0039368513 /DNA_START=40 /DNA_END=1887 /DNA_ORIENTATION=+
MSLFTLNIVKANNVPAKDLVSPSDPFVTVTVFVKAEEVATVSTSHVDDTHTPEWREELKFQDASGWDLDATTLKFEIYDYNKFIASHYIGETTVSLRDLLKHPSLSLLMENKRFNFDPVVDNNHPNGPCYLFVEVGSERPAGWPSPSPRTNDTYERHIFMVTRGTRGDVQPFVALARGMAEEFGWLVTICSELPWKSWIKAKTCDVSRGKVEFLPSGGNTEITTNSKIGQMALSSKFDTVQMLMMGFSEAAFFASCTTIVASARRAQVRQPISLVMYGFTLCQVGIATARCLRAPSCGFILQPTCIPSQDSDWHPVQQLTGSRFTDFKTLTEIKQKVELVDKVPNTSLDLQPVEFWNYIRARKQPLLIPMNASTFKRPSDFWDKIITSSFIFLRPPKGSVTNSSLGPELDGFVQKAKADSAKLGIITVSSMPGCRTMILEASRMMVEQCKVADFRIIYVGLPPSDKDRKMPRDVEHAIQKLKSEARLFEADRADFGILFGHLDVFVVHGGLGTTVEALRIGKPVAVTGPLALDQRWWGKVVHDKNIGPPPAHIDKFHEVCVDFINNALDPSDPQGWQRSARQTSWGAVDDDGVSTNARCIRDMLEEGEIPALSSV